MSRIYDLSLHASMYYILQEIDSCGSRLVELSRKVVNVHTGKSTKTPDKAVKRGGIQFVGFDD